MKNNKKQNQHIVPKFYLKNFSVNNQIQVYDLVSCKSFSSSINVTATRKCINNLPEAFVKKAMGTKEYLDYKNKFPQSSFEEFYEDLFANTIETDYSKIIKALVTYGNSIKEKVQEENKIEFPLSKKNIKNNKISGTVTYFKTKDFEIVKDFIFSQYFRSPKLHAKVLDEPVNKILKNHDKFKNEFSNTDFNKNIVAFDKNIKSTLINNNYIFNPEFIKEFKYFMRNKNVRIGIDYSNSLITSDNPVIIRNSSRDINYFKEIEEKSVHFILPVSPSIVIFLKEQNDNLLKFEVLTKEYVDFLNKLQIKNCERQIYSSKDDFLKYEKIVKKEKRNNLEPDFTIICD